MDAMTKPCIGHTHLKVADLERAIAFWRDVLGMDLTQRYGDQAAFLSWGGYHHHIGLNTWHSAGGTPPPPRHTGLYHVALLYPTRHALAVAAKRVADAGVRIYGHADHGVSLALYFDDPDGNGIEIYWDKPQEDWPWQADGSLKMGNDRFDLNALLAEAG
ncbi:VOC family protein [Roseinatronobacter sp.]|uniref:VOC family protein n=1 Tax=Roseinatronobacter sp. TaxID=1945755 RepID=UPI0025ED6961|nr:VOC family protein [Roseibaca sp.]